MYNKVNFLFMGYLNKKKGTLNIPMVLSLGLGGFVGALSSSFICCLSSFTSLRVKSGQFAHEILAILKTLR